MRVVIVADPNRKDFYDYIVSQLEREHDLYFLWDYESDQGRVSGLPDHIQMLYWKTYLTPQELIRKVNPDRILFFEIIDFWQIPLIITCHALKITTFFIEHGVGNSVDMVLARFNELPSFGKRIIYYTQKIISRFNRVIRNRLFFMSAIRYLSQADRRKFLKLIFYYKKYTPIHALSLLKFRARTPNYAILFNRNNIDPFLLYNTIEMDNIIANGVPLFDKYYRNQSHLENHIIFIDHPYLEVDLLKWNDAFHEKVARALERFAVTNNIKVIVKLHPRSKLENWLRYELNPLVKIKQKEDITDEMLSAKMILGYSSTLMNVMIACKKNVVFLGWHPQPQIWGDDLSKTGLCHVSLDINDLDTKYDAWLSTNLSETNEDLFSEFLKEYNYPFDGKATQRVIRAILENAVN